MSDRIGKFVFSDGAKWITDCTRDELLEVIRYMCERERSRFASDGSSLKNSTEGTVE